MDRVPRNGFPIKAKAIWPFNYRGTPAITIRHAVGGGGPLDSQSRSSVIVPWGRQGLIMIGGDLLGSVQYFFEKDRVKFLSLLDVG